MLNKQGLFTRNTASSNPAPNTRPIPGSLSATPGRQDDEFVMPGHLAAIESATSTTPSSLSPVALTKPSDARLAEPSPLPEAKANSGSKLIVGPDVKLKGAEILDCDTLLVEGRVEATMDSRIIQIAEKGVFSGKVVIDVAEIYGQFDGDLTARGQLIIHATGRVTGKIRYGKINIEEGGELSGDIAAITQEVVKSSTRPNLNS
jgi:cytoskeletal protein CcmA (bactofilin family)